MSGVVLAGAILCGLVLAGVAVSFFVLVRAGGVTQAAERRIRAAQAAQQAALGDLRRELDGLGAQLHEVRTQPHTPSPAAPRAGLNLGRRSQALRLHRRGQPPRQIAAELGIPVQEVELLIKVHEIVMRTV